MNTSREPTRIPVAFDDGDAAMSELVARAMASARVAQIGWSRMPLIHRLKLVRKLRQLIAEHAMQLAEASAAARQRPALEALTAEVLPLAEACRFLERNARKILAPQRFGGRGRPLWLAGVRSEIRREPFGVVLIIGPGNYPLLLAGAQLIQALVAGNAVLFKPGIGGTPAAGVLVDLMVRAGFDSQLVALLPETAAAARTAISARPDKVVFTGSAATGENILAQLAPHLIPATMELSGNDAVIIRDDADLDLATKALGFSLSLNAGATCLSPKRVFVHRRLATELEGRLANVFRRSSEDAQPSCYHQNLLSATTADKLRPLLEDAIAQGAHFIAGDSGRDGTIVGPIILAGVSPASRLLREDIFAPILSIVTVADDHEAVRCANDCPFALGASIFSRDEMGARWLASEIHAGIITINDLILPTADARLPFGGRGRSGLGVTRGAEGLLELTTPKVVTRSRGKFRPGFDPPHAGDGELFQSYLNLIHGDGLKTRCRALASLIKAIARRHANSRKVKS